MDDAARRRPRRRPRRPTGSARSAGASRSPGHRSGRVPGHRRLPDLPRHGERVRPLDDEPARRRGPRRRVGRRRPAGAVRRGVHRAAGPGRDRRAGCGRRGRAHRRRPGHRRGAMADDDPAPPAADTSVDRGFSDGSTSMFATADGLGVVLAGRRITLLDAARRRGALRPRRERRLLRGPGQRDRGRRTRWTTRARPSTTIVGGGPDLGSPAARWTSGSDDGSVPGVVLMADTTVRAYDRATGDVRWTVRHVIAGNALVLRGRVYLSTGGGVRRGRRAHRRGAVARAGRTRSDARRPGDGRAPPAQLAAAAGGGG